MMSSSTVKKLMSFWLSDKNNETLLGDLFENISRTSDLSTFEEVYSKAPLDTMSSPVIHAHCVELLIRCNQLDSAKQHLAKYHAVMSLWNHYFEALIQFTESNFEGCIQAFKCISDDSDVLPMTYALYARAYYMQGKIADAQQVIEVYLAKHATAEALGLYAMCWLDQGEYEKSEHFALLAIQQSENQLDALLALASCAIAKLDIETAQKYTRLCLEINPSIGRTWSLAGQIDLYNGQYDSGAVALEKAIALMPDHIGTYHLLAWTYLILGEVEKANLQFQNALDLNLNFADSHAGLAIIAINKGQIENAQQLVKKALRLDSTSFTANYAQSLLLAHSGDEVAAKQVIERILKSKSNLNMSYQQLIEKAVKEMNARSGQDNEH